VSGRRPAYALSWEWDRRCTGCGRFCSENGTAGYDRAARLRWCEPCVIGRELRPVVRQVAEVEPEERAA
jgi:hypothetical protein